ncbi:MAG: hypothetical protein RIR94_1521 [Bacteroidota bacterium]
MIEVKALSGKVFLTHLLVIGFVFFEGLSNRDDICLDLALRLAQLDSRFFYR